MSFRLYDEPVPNDRGGEFTPMFTAGEDDLYWYDFARYGFNHRLMLTPKAAPQGWDWAWCFRGPRELVAGLFVWNPETQNEPLGWHKRPTYLRSRVAPRAAEQPEYNRLRCIHGCYPEDGICGVDRFCAAAMQRLHDEQNAVDNDFDLSYLLGQL